MNNIHNSSVIAKSVQLGENVYIGPNCIIGYPDRKSNSLIQPASEYSKVIIGDNCKIFGNSVICEGAELGNGCTLDYFSYIGSYSSLGNFVNVKYGGRIYSRVRIGNYNSISGFVANDCIVGEYSIIQGSLIHAFKDVNFGTPEPAPIIDDYVFIGMNATVIGGIKIAKGCYIGSSSVVLNDTNEGKLYVGNPAIEKGNAPKPYYYHPYFNKKKL